MSPSQRSKLSPAAVIGPGRVGLVLAIFLDRIGVEVTVGTRSERGRERGEAAGLAIADPTEATRGASLSSWPFPTTSCRRWSPPWPPTARSRPGRW